MNEADQRPDPDALLASLPDRRGRLKLFFGAAPGVGKTYAMLAEAHELGQQGLDVLVAWVDTHGRSETEAMLQGLSLLPRLSVSHKGRERAALDIDGVLARRPALVIIDELPHSNAPGCRHAKRWQDIEEILAAGIDVYSAMNVQHLDSLRDIVASVSGIAVSETVPDHVFDAADEVRLVDLPPDDLLQRLAAGKVYLPDVAERAAANFFRKGNLIALRELALRRMADRVDGQMREQRAVSPGSPVWATNLGLLQLIRPDDDSDSLRQCQRLSRQLGAPWHAVWIDHGQGGDERRREATRSLQQAEDSGAITLILHGHDAAALLLAYARRHNLSLLVLPPGLGVRQWRRLSVLSSELNILCLSGKPPRRHWAWPAIQPGWHGWLPTTLLCALTTAVTLPLQGTIDATNLVMFYLLVVLWSAVRYGRGPAAWAAVLSVALFDFFFVLPYLSFAVSDIQYLITFVVMLSVGLVAGQLVASQRQSATQASAREAHTRTLYEMARELGSALLPEQVADITRRYLADSLQARLAFALPDAQDVLQAADNPQLATDAAIVRWCFDHAEAAGSGTHTLADAPLLYLPLKAPMRTRGVLAIELPQAGQLADPDCRRLCEAAAALAAQTLERLHYIEVAQQTLVTMESERLRHSLLAALSHDLRTPLTAMIGQAEQLARTLGREASPQVAAANLLTSQAQRMARMVNNLLDMARLQSGSVTLRESWLPVEELVGTATAALGEVLARHRLDIRLPADCPLLFGDAILLERLLVNLLENAVKYSPAGSTITLSASHDAQSISVQVADQGRGLPDVDPARLFDAFSRGERESVIAGAGLGLAICRTIADVHHGQLTAANHPQGGAVFSLSLPLHAQPSLDFDMENDES